MAQGERRWYTVIMAPHLLDALVLAYWVEATSADSAALIARSEAGVNYHALAVYIGRLKDQTEQLWCKEIKEERGG